MSTLDPERVSLGCGFWFFWTLSSMVGMGIGWAAGWALSIVGPPAIASAVIGASAGVSLGFIQLLVLRLWFPGVGRWVILTLVGWLVGFLAGVEVSYLGGFAELVFGGTVGAVVGLSLGVLQWIYLRDRIAGAGWWIAVSTLGWAAGLLLYRPGINAMGLVYGLQAGLLTGGFLVWQTRKFPTAGQGDHREIEQI